jgi:hypothetical protein
LEHFFLFFLFIRFYALLQYALPITLHGWLVAVDAKNFSDVILVDFKRKNYPYLAKRLKQDQHGKKYG